jgi:hypothetical protein
MAHGGKEVQLRAFNWALDGVVSFTFQPLNLRYPPGRKFGTVLLVSRPGRLTSGTPWIRGYIYIGIYVRYYAFSWPESYRSGFGQATRCFQLFTCDLTYWGQQALRSEHITFEITCNTTEYKRQRGTPCKMAGPPAYSHEQQVQGVPKVAFLLC